jgi:DNA-directed RNA polymerase subunit RPC12/RpoP
MIVFECNVCRTALSAEEAQGGQLVRCPKCLTTLRVPVAERAAVGAGAATVGASAAGAGGGGAGGAGGMGRSAGFDRGPSTMLSSSPRAAGRRFGFNCGYCSSRLEANESMSGQEGQCPTCGNSIVIPILDRYGRLIDPMTGKIIKPDPHPVHAYAAAGERAPRILRSDDGRQTIMCPRCQSLSPITANNCKSCGMPFTMEGTTLEAAGTSNGFCVASLVLGIIGIPAFCIVLPPILAIVFGIIGYNQVSKTGAEGAGKGMAIAGIICGVIGSFIAAASFLS